MTEHDPQARDLEREADDMQRRSEHLEEEISEARDRADASRRDIHVEGAGPDPEREEGGEPPPEQEFPAKGDA